MLWATVLGMQSFGGGLQPIIPSNNSEIILQFKQKDFANIQNVVCVNQAGFMPK